MTNRDAVRLILGIGCILGLIGGIGCALLGRPQSGPGDAEATTDRMVETYSDLASKKFQVVADFETADQSSLFRHEAPGAGGTVEMTTQQSRRETGVGALRMSFADSSQQAVATDSPDSKWALVRDWTPYHLLIFSVFSSRSLTGFHFSARSGTSVPLTYTRSRINLEPGWNLVRIDLGLLSDQINLADVRELRFGCDPLESPVDLYLDDLILVNNARHVFGPEAPGPGDLFVRTEGGRLVVGAAERFELVFSDGSIRQWYDLGSDPLKARNLTGGQALGPVPVALPESGRSVGFPEQVLKAAGPGPTLEAWQELLEANPLRIVVRCEWRPRSQDQGFDTQAPPRRWLYSILRDGRVYVECTGITADATGPGGIGVAFCGDADAGFRLTLMSRSAEAVGPGGREPYALFSRETRGQADLLVVPFGTPAGQAMQPTGDPRLCVAWMLPGEEARFAFAGLARVWPPDIDGAAQAVPLVTDYRSPLPMQIDAGGLARSDPGDFDRDGFSEGRGYYSLQLDGTIAKLRIPGAHHLRFSPLFRILEVADRDVWVYVDGRQIETVREGQGDVLFEVTGTIANEVLVEVTSRAKGRP